MRNYQNCLLDPEQSAVIIVDHQPQMYFSVESASRQTIENNVVGLAKAAKLFGVPCILTTVAAKTFSGPMIKKILDVYPGEEPIDRTSLNCWEDQNLRKAVEETGRKKIVIAGLWTEVCVCLPAISMISEQYEIYAALDACGGSTSEAHDMAVQRMVKAGVKPMAWLQVMLEWQRDWNNKETYDGVMSICKEHASAYGLGIEYSEEMLPKQ